MLRKNCFPPFGHCDRTPFFFFLIPSLWGRQEPPLQKNPQTNLQVGLDSARWGLPVPPNLQAGLVQALHQRLLLTRQACGAFLGQDVLGSLVFQGLFEVHIKLNRGYLGVMYGGHKAYMVPYEGRLRRHVKPTMGYTGVPSFRVRLSQQSSARSYPATALGGARGSMPSLN